MLSLKLGQNGKLPSWQISLFCRDNLLFVATAVTCRGTSHPRLRPIVFQLRCRDHITPLKELFLSRHECFVTTSTLFFFLLFLLSHDINFCCDISFCRDTSFCRDLVSICLKIIEHTAFHSSASLKFAASIKSTPHSNSNIHSIQFPKNLDKEKNAPPFFSNSFFL